MPEIQRCLTLAILASVITIFCNFACGQELDPRAYQPAPIGLNVLTLAYTHSTGDVLFEPSFPAEDVQADLHSEAAGYYHSFGLFGRFSNLSVGVPYSTGHLNGRIEGIPREIYRSGLGDIRTRFAINLKGTPAMTMSEFIKHRSKTNIGVSLIVSAPTGQYDSGKVVNVGQNRWALKPEVGLSKFYKKWQMDIYGGAWFFSENDNFRGGTQSQDPVGSFQFHLTYNLRPRMWLGLNTNFYTGGRTTINGVPGAIKQKNSRIGSTLMLPLGKAHSVKIAVSKGVVATRGGNFTSVGASYNFAWDATK